jgi:DNA mismatch repair protein MutL
MSIDAQPRTSSIRILPEDVANKIAAGEVVERPASVVKELVENSLDAGATQVTVHLVAAGQRLVQVTDNGCGMSEQDALLSVERHATSKLRTAEDLEDVTTLGFRGEALASIAAVSRFTLITRRAQDTLGTKVQVDGGVLRSVEQVGAPVGTQVNVSRLYFNTPARAKFLKGFATELGHCIDAVQNYAMSYLGVGFHLCHNDRTLLQVPPTASLRDRIGIILGLPTAREMVEVEAEDGGMRLRGLVGTPNLTRSSRSHQWFFVNRRPVVNRVLRFALEDAYRSLVMVNRYPVAVLQLEIHPRRVDVNIHPTKREVRFRDERAVRDFIRDAIRAHLENVGRSYPTVVSPSPGRSESPQDGEISRTTSSVGTEEPAKTEASAPSAAPATTACASAPSPTDTGSLGDAHPLDATPVPTPQRDQDAEPTVSPPPLALHGEPTRSAPAAQPTLPGIESPSPRISLSPMYERLEDVRESPMQVFDTYLLVPMEDRILIIDQHALHERLNYDRLVAELADSQYEAQQFVMPIVLEVPPNLAPILEKHLSLFSKLGVELEPFGPNVFQVVAACHLYDEKKVADIIFAVLDELAQGNLFDRGNFMAELLRIASRACKASIRAGDTLTPQERRALLEGFRRLRPPYTCPHGRPIIVEVTQREVEKVFRRIP